jgi:hypothetical protein
VSVRLFTTGILATGQKNCMTAKLYLPTVSGVPLPAQETSTMDNTACAK